MSIKVESTSIESEAARAKEGTLASETVEPVETKSEATLEAAAETTEESDASDEVETENEGEPSLEEKPKKLGGFKKRIDKLNAKNSAQAKELEYWRRVALEKSKPEPEKQSPATQITETGVEPKEDGYTTHSEYMEALISWKVDQKLTQSKREEKAEQIKAEQQKTFKTLKAQYDEYASANEDFAKLMEDSDVVKITSELRDAIQEADNFPKLMHELAKNLEEYERIAALPDRQAIKELGKFEARIAAAEEPSTETHEPITTKAPKPIKPVGTNTSGSVKKSIFDSSLNQQEYERIRKEQIAKRA